jgi:hypothetical protein
VMQSAMVAVPALVGWLRPVILLPASVVTGMPATHLDAVIAHELAHVRRHDYLINALQAVVETLLFYHPAVWWCSRQVRIEREHCCDDLAVMACGDRVEYATALANLEELRRGDMPLALAVTDGPLLGRVRRLLGVRPAHEGRCGRRCPRYRTGGGQHHAQRPAGAVPGGLRHGRVAHGPYAASRVPGAPDRADGGVARVSLLSAVFPVAARAAVAARGTDGPGGADAA